MEDEVKLRFYGRRKGRALTKYQKELIETKLPQVAVSLDNLSGKKVWLEIGFGGGEHLSFQAGLFPEVSFIGCEPFLNGVASLLTHLEREKRTNVSIFHGDARALVKEMPPQFLEKVFILYPDPWPKARHGKRRIIQTEFIKSLAKILKPNGEIVIATDDDNYADHVAEVFASLPEYSGPNTKDGQTNPPQNWIETRYEARAKRLGNTSYYFNYIHHLSAPGCVDVQAS